MLYTRFAWTIRLIDAGNDNYRWVEMTGCLWVALIFLHEFNGLTFCRLAYTKGEAKLVLSVLSVDQPLVYCP